MNVSRIRRLERKAVTIMLKAQDIAAEVNSEFGPESGISDFADDVVCSAETLVDGFSRLPAILKVGGQP